MKSLDKLLNSGNAELADFSAALNDRLVEAGVPQKLFGGDFVPALLGFLIEYVQGCLLKKSAYAIVSSIVSFDPISEFIFRRRAARKLYRGQKNYQSNFGDESIDSLLELCSDYDRVKLEKLVEQIKDSDVPEVNPDPIPVDLPSL